MKVCWGKTQFEFCYEGSKYLNAHFLWKINFVGMWLQKNKKRTQAGFLHEHHKWDQWGQIFCWTAKYSFPEDTSAHSRKFPLLQNLQNLPKNLLHVVAFSLVQTSCIYSLLSPPPRLACTVKGPASISGSGMMDIDGKQICKYWCWSSPIYFRSITRRAQVYKLTFWWAFIPSLTHCCQPHDRERRTIFILLPPDLLYAVVETLHNHAIGRSAASIV